jgi:ATP-binding cassette subfamily F protein uup
VFLVTHDRAFLDNVVTQVIAPEGEGVWREYAGGYEEWERVRRARVGAAVREPARPAPERTQRRGTSDAHAPTRLSFGERRELETLPGQIEALEQEYDSVSARLSDPTVYRDEPQEVGRLKDRFAALESRIEEAMRRWEEMERRSI